MIKKWFLCVLSALLLLGGTAACQEPEPSPVDGSVPNYSIAVGWEEAFFAAIDSRATADELSMGNTVPFQQYNLRKRSGSVITLEDPEGVHATVNLSRPYVILKDGVAVDFDPPDYYYDFRVGSYKTAVKVGDVTENTFRICYVDGDFSQSDRLVPRIFDAQSWSRLSSALSAENREIFLSFYAQVSAEDFSDEWKALYPSASGTCYLLRSSADEVLASQILAGAGYTLMQCRDIEAQCGYSLQPAARFVIPCQVQINNGAVSEEILFDQIYCSDPSYQVVDARRLTDTEPPLADKVPSALIGNG